MKKVKPSFKSFFLDFEIMHQSLKHFPVVDNRKWKIGLAISIVLFPLLTLFL